ncbi:MAG: hypothetical protein K8F54_00600 [Altibacter sp.]|uniref:HYC_CC_PP family protein n=1 Tax=Altibacter sp. TaxID=2024823 RepID=UPI001D4567E7|nr:hypothetical protein [Altibacter sp.]MBZ0326077.1 hypothetical protein [Altibacter sp.]
MKELFHKIMSLFMAFVVLFSTMSFTVDMHFCGDTLVDTAIFKEAKSCGMEMNKTTPTSDCSITKKDCCTDKQLMVDGQDELKISADKISFDQQVFIASFYYTYKNLFEGLEEKVTAFSEYPPPIIVRQIYKLDETYLI